MGLPWDDLDTHGATFFQPLKDVEPGIPQPARRAAQDSNWHGPKFAFCHGAPLKFADITGVENGPQIGNVGNHDRRLEAADLIGFP